MRKILSILLLLTLWLYSATAYSATDIGTAIHVDSIDSASWPHIGMKVTLPVNDATAQNISLAISGLQTPLAPDNIKPLGDNSEVKNLLVAIDTSKSLGDAYLEAIKTALKDYIHHLGHNEQIAVLAFNDTVQIASGFTDEPARIEAALATLRQGGVKTELNQALLAGVNLLRQLPGKKNMLVISDGHNEGSGSTEEVVQAAKAARINIFAVALPEKHMDQKLHQQQLQILASQTGGAFQAVDSPLSAASGIFTILQAERQKNAVGYEYQISFTAPTDFEVTEQPLKAVFSQKSGNGALSVNVELNAPLTKKSLPENGSSGSQQVPEKSIGQQTLEFVKSPAGIGCAIAAALVLVLLLYLILRRRKNSRQQLEQTVIVQDSQRAMSSPFVLELVTQSMSFPLPYGKIRLGAAKDNEIVINDPTVSRKHACIEVTGQECRLTDTNSTNGTFVNGERISRPCLLVPGDQIYFGKTHACLRAVM